jgi:hypothetical protein
MSVPGSLFYLTADGIRDENGDNLGLGFVQFKVAGEDTDKDTWTTADMDVANTNPVQLDASGYATVFLEPGAYDVTIFDSDMVEVRQYLGVEDIGQTFFSQFGTIQAEGQKNLVANYTVTNDDNFVTFSGTVAKVLTLQAAADRQMPLSIWNDCTVAWSVTPDGSETIDGDTGAYSLASGGKMVLLPVTSGYLIQSLYVP